MEQRSVKCFELLPRPALYLDSVQFLRPRGACRPGGLFECSTIRNLFIEVPPSLLDRNEGHADADVHGMCVPRKDGITAQHGAIACAIARTHRAVLYCPERDEWRIETRDEVSAEALGAVGSDDEILPLGIRASNLTRGGVDRDGTGRVGDIGRVGRTHHRCTRGLEEHVGRLGTQECEAEVPDAGGFGGGQAGSNKVGWALLRTGTLLGEDRASFNCIHAHAVIARCRELVIVAKLHPAVCEVALDCAGAGDDDDLCALAHPNGRLVGALEAMYLGIGVVIRRDRHVVFARLSNPARHGERRCSRRDHTPRTVWRVSTIPNEPVSYDLRKQSWEWSDCTHGLTKSTDLLFGSLNPEGGA